jgi:hypothetical protein
MQDNSPELKKGEIKQILIQSAKESLPDFEFLAYQNSCYTFQRLRQANKLTVREALHVVFSLKDRNFTCTVASRLNPKYIFSKPYNMGLINPHIDIKTLRHGSSALSIQDAYYFHNGQVDTTTKVVREIFEDFKVYGIPFLDKQFENVKSNLIIKSGFDFIDNLQIDKEKLESEISEELQKTGFLISSGKNPTYNALKEHMQSVSGQSIEDRRKIPYTAYELLGIYWAR